MTIMGETYFTYLKSSKNKISSRNCDVECGRSTVKAGFKVRSAGMEADTLTTRPTRRLRVLRAARINLNGK